MKNNTFTKDFWGYLFVFILIIVIICHFPSWFTQPGKLDFRETGQIGDTIGGIMGPFVAIAAAILTFFAFWVQYKANEQQRKDIALERFESNLFELIHIQQDITNNLLLECTIKGVNETNMQYEKTSQKGRDIFQLIYQDMLLGGENKGIKDIVCKDNWESEYLKCKHIGCLDHYFRHLYRIFKYIDDSHKKLPNLTKDDRYEYASLVRASLSQYELIMLFYNCLSKNGNDKFKRLIEEYAVFNNLRTELLAKQEEQNLYASKFLDNYPYSQDENRNMDTEYKKEAFVYNKKEMNKPLNPTNNLGH